MKMNTTGTLPEILSTLGYRYGDFYEIFTPELASKVRSMLGKHNDVEVNTYEIYKLLIPTIGHPNYTGYIFDIPTKFNLDDACKWINRISLNYISNYTYSNRSNIHTVYETYITMELPIREALPVMGTSSFIKTLDDIKIEVLEVPVPDNMKSNNGTHPYKMLHVMQTSFEDLNGSGTWRRLLDGLGKLKHLELPMFIASGQDSTSDTVGLKQDLIIIDKHSLDSILKESEILRSRQMSMKQALAEIKL